MSCTHVQQNSCILIPTHLYSISGDHFSNYATTRTSSLVGLYLFKDGVRLSKYIILYQIISVSELCCDGYPNFVFIKVIGHTSFINQRKRLSLIV